MVQEMENCKGLVYIYKITWSVHMLRNYNGRFTQHWMSDFPASWQLAQNRAILVPENIVSLNVFKQILAGRQQRKVFADAVFLVR